MRRNGFGDKGVSVLLGLTCPNHPKASIAHVVYLYYDHNIEKSEWARPRFTDVFDSKDNIVTVRQEWI